MNSLANSSSTIRTWFSMHGRIPTPGRGAALEQHAEKQTHPETVATMKQVRPAVRLCPPPSLYSCICSSSNHCPTVPLSNHC